MQAAASAKLVTVRAVLRATLLAAIAAACTSHCAARGSTMADLQSAIAAGSPVLRFQVGPAAWELVRVPAGDFVMGTPLDEPGRQDGEVPPMRVTLTRAFYIGRYEITQGQYAAVMNENPSEFSGDDLAVDQIKYSDALEYTRRLSNLTGTRVTLPTEAQWEYACRGGTTTPFCAGTTEADLDRVAWYRANSGKSVHNVGQKAPNAWGIYDMHGNVAEPTLDYILSFETLTTTDPVGSRFSTHAAARGGAWMEPADRCRAGARIQTNDMFGGMGIRIVILP